MVSLVGLGDRLGGTERDRLLALLGGSSCGSEVRFEGEGVFVGVCVVVCERVVLIVRAGVLLRPGGREGTSRSRGFEPNCFLGRGAMWASGEGAARS